MPGPGFNTVPFNNGPFNDPSGVILDVEVSSPTDVRIIRHGFSDYLYVDSDPAVSVRILRYGFVDYISIDGAAAVPVRLSRRNHALYVTYL